MAVPLMQQATELPRNLGVPHIALRKMVASALIAALIAVPCSVAFALLIAPFGKQITSAAPWLFLVAAVLIARFSAGRWASVFLLIPFVALILALQAFTAGYGTKLSISYFLGIAVGPLVADLFSALSPAERTRMARAGRAASRSPRGQGWKGYFPNPLKILDGIELRAPPPAPRSPPARPSCSRRSR